MIDMSRLMAHCTDSDAQSEPSEAALGAQRKCFGEITVDPCHGMRSRQSVTLHDASLLSHALANFG